MYFAPFRKALLFTPVTNSETIDVGDTDGHVWVRVEGKGSFSGSPQLKEYVERRIGDGARRFVIDLAECPAMDSTFMGTLAGMAMRLSKVGGDRLQLAAVNERNRQSLEDLGLDVLLDINPSDPEWGDEAEMVRESLEPLADDSDSPDAAHVLESHRQLCEVNQDNVKKFATVIDVLEREATSD